MTTDTQSTSGQSETTTQSATEPKTLTSPGLSFTEYETLRRGGTLPEEKATTSAPEAKEGHEQKTTSESETEETESKGSESEETESGDELETESKDESEKEEQETSEKPKKKGGFQRRIDKLNQRMAAREQELEYWKQQATKVAGDSKADPKVETKQASVSAEGKPDPDKFDTHAEYVEALTDWILDQKLKETAQKQERAKFASDQEKLAKSYIERKEAFAKKVTDFDAVISEVEHIPVSAAVREIILSSENGPELAYELAKNEDEFSRVCKLPPLAAARELGKLEAKIAAQVSAEKKPEAKKVTSAPKPLETVKASGKGSTQKSINDPGLSFAEYERLRREQINKRKRA